MFSFVYLTLTDSMLFCKLIFFKASQQMKTCLSNCPWEAVSAYYSIIFHWCWSEVAQGLACTHFTETRYQQSYLPKPQVWEWDWTSEILPNTCNTTCSSQRDRGQTLPHLFWNSWCLSWGLAHTRRGRNVWWVDCPSFSHHSAQGNCTATFLWLLK